MKKIVLDIETQNTFQEVGSRDVAALDISLLVVYDYETDKYLTFFQDNFKELWALLENRDTIIGYNSDNFDIPLLDKYYPGDLTQMNSLDLLEEIRKSLGKRMPLQSVAAGTLGKGKLGGGLEAVRWWKNGEIEKIEKYCREDVVITKEIYEYAMKYGELKYRLLNDLYSFPVDTSMWESGSKGGMNYTLPF